MNISDSLKKKLQERKNTTTSTVRTTSGKTNHVDAAARISQIRKKVEKKKMNFDTLENDLQILSKRINSVNNEWQTRETMINTRVAVQNMYDRLGKYQDYQKAYGGTDLSEIRSAYKSVLDEWDNVVNLYGSYKDADEYNKALEKTRKEAEAYEGMTKADLNALQTEIADLEEIYKTAQQHDSKVKGLTRRGANFDSRARGKGTIADKITTAENELNEFLGSYGYESTDALKNALDEKKLYFDNAKRIQDGIALAEKESAMASSAQATEGLKKWDEFVADREKAKTEGKNLPDWIRNLGYIDNPTAQMMDIKREDTSFQEPQDDWTQEERNIFGAYYLENPESAYDYAARLNNQKALAEKEKGKQKYSDKATSGVGSGILHTAGAVLTSPLAMADYLDDVTDIAAGRRTIVEEGAVSPFDYSQAVTSGVSNKLNNMYGTLSEDIPIIGGKGVGDVYGLGTSILQSAVSASTLGPYGTLVSYFGQGAASATDDALARGADAEQALMYGTIVGAAEGVSEMIGVDNLLKVGKASTLKGFFKNVLKQAGAEGLEEGFSSVVDKIADNFVMKDKSNLNAMASRLVAQGMSYEEAKNKAWLETVEEVAFDVLSGAISGALHAAPRTAAATAMSHFSEVKAGKNIRANDRIGEVFDIASNPEVASAYEAYTEYANKGINAENISDAQLGNLAYSAVEEAYNVINSDTATAEQKAQARKTIADLEVFVQKTPGKVSKKEAKKYDADMVRGIIDAGLESDTDSESYRLATEYNAKVEDGKSLTPTEISKLVNSNESSFRADTEKAVRERLTELGETKVSHIGGLANIIARKINGEEITADEYKAVEDSKYGKQVLLENTDADIVSQAEAMETDDGELFMRLYDGKTDAEAYANSFNLVAEYAKAPSISTDYVLEHRGVLTPSQTSQIYNHFAVKASKEARIKFDQEAQKQFTDAIAKMEENLKVSREGFVDTSVIDFTNSSTEGKVNWKDLKPRQQQAVTFVSGLFKAMGANVVFVDKTKKFNGMYHQEGDTVFVDVYAGMDIVKMVGKDSIIPTTAHELTHMMEVHSPGEFKELADMVLDYLAEVKHLTRQELIANEMARLDEKHSDDAPHSEKDAISEIVARACEDMLSASKEGRRLFESLSEEQQKSFVDKVKEIFKKLTEWLDKLLNSYESTSDEAKAIRGVKSVFDEVSARWDKMLADIAVGNTADAQTEITSIGSRDLSDLSGAVGLDGKSLFQYRAFEADKDIYREMLLKHKDVIGITDLQIVELFSTIDKAVNIISNNLEALDYAWEADIDDRAFSPVKPNSDNLYKVSLDFSTLCRKRLLQQTIQATLQETLNKQLSKEEAIAIRDELMKLQEEGRKIEIACALCYVESARMKSPVQINRFLNNRESVIREFFANRSGGSIKDKVASAEQKAREELAKQHPDGLIGKNNAKVDILSAPMSHMQSKYAQYIRDAKKEAKKSYELTAHERSELEAALDMSVSDFTSAEGLEWLAKNHRDIFDAYTSFVRNATHSKGIENDTWWRAGDSDAIGDNLIAQMNSENGLRSQSWSDFQVIHLLDYIAATLELSTKGAKRQSYTKVPDYVKLLGNTGDMINMSLIPTSEFSGKLAYDPVEGMAYDIAKQLRDEYHKTVGTICIGINNEQISLLLEDDTIDMVIPYHHSSMSKATRKLMHIPAWESYQDYQSEKKLSDAEAKARAKEYGVELKKDSMYQKAPKFSEWFNLEEARQIAKMENANPSDMEAYKKYGKMYGGYMAMQNAANNYLKLCAERGLAPKFSAKESDFTHDANYWKLLIDRKMVDSVTGEIIEQMPIKPIFNEQSILEILNDELARYEDVKADQEYAAQTVLRKFLSGDMKVDKSTLEALQNPVDNVTKVNILESAEGTFKLSDRNNTPKEFNEYSVQTALWEAFDHNDKGFDNLIKVSQMPKYFVNLLGIDGDLYIYRDHAYENMVSKEAAETDGRPTRRNGKNINFHNLGIETMAEAMLSMQNPSVTIADKMADGNPAVLMVLPVFDESGMPLYGVVSFYSNRIVNGDFTTKPHILLTIYKRDYFVETSKGRQGLVEIINEAIEDGRIVDFDRKKIRDDLPVIAQRTRLGNITEKSLNTNLSQFRKEVKAYREKNNILYSERETTNIYDIMGERDRLKKRNEILEADIKRLKEMSKLDKKVTMGKYLDRGKLSTIAKYIKKISNSTIEENALVDRLNEVYLSMRNAADYTWDELFGKFYAVAEEVLAEAKPVVMKDDYAKMILREIKATRISLSESQKAEAQHIFGKNWNRHFMGKVIIANDGTPIDSQWQEWAELYPYLFKKGVNEKDMIAELYNIIESVRDASEWVKEYDEAEMTQWLATEIYNKHWTATPLHTTADKYDAQIKVLKFEHRKAMQEMRATFKESQKDALNEQRIKYKKLIADLRTQRDEGIARAKQHGRDMLDKYKDNAERKTRIQRITANALTLNKWLKTNNKDYHIHEAMKGPVIKLLNAIDFSSGRLLSGGNPTQRDISLAEAFAEVRTMLANATNMVTGLEELYGHDLTESIELLAEGAFALIGDNSYTINTMSNEELYHLDKLVRHIKKAVTQLNNFHVVQRSQGAWNLGEEFIEYGKKLKKLDKQHGTFGKFFVFRNRTPYYFFKELGSAGQKMFEAFQDGWDKLAFNAKKVIDFSENTYTSKEVQKWSEEKKTFTLSQPDGSQRTIEMSIAQIMSLHCVAKQDDAQYHLFGGGMTLKRIDKKGHVITDYENISLTMADVQKITSALDRRQIEVADKLQEFMNTVCSDWGNEISMARFGSKMFGIKDYFPIKVSSATVPTDTKKDIDNASLFRLLNMSFTKGRKHNAPQSVEIGDVFDIFAQHSADMAKYNALALPVLDFAKWYSMHGMDANGKEYGVVQTLQSVFGDEADGYLRRFIRDINGSQNVSRDVLGNKLFKNAKVASVAANLRVVLLQPTAYFKASAVMNNKYLMKASSYVKVNPVSMIGKLKKAAEQAEKYCGIIQWKSLGYYDTDISKGLTAKIKHSDGILDKLIEKSMKGAEIADKATFATLWIACEFEIRDTRKDLKVGSKEFYDAIGKRLRDIVYATQVVDSTMTRSDMMRSSDGRDKMLTTFGSEPILAYNMLLDLVTTYNRDKQALGKSVARKKNANKIRKVVTAYVITNAVAAIVESGFDYLRDDEDEIDVAEFMKMWLSNFVSDISIGNKLPIIKDIYSMAQGYSASRMDVQGIGYVFNVIKDVDKLINGKGDWMRLIKDVIRAGSSLSGLPAYNIFRDAMALLDKLDIVGED